MEGFEHHAKESGLEPIQVIGVCRISQSVSPIVLGALHNPRTVG